MDEIYKAFASLIAKSADPKHWPFFMVLVVLTVIGHIMSTRFFTRARAYDKSVGRAAQFVWWWGRETLPLHPFCAAFVLCFVWPDPERSGMLPPETGAYWTGCAACSLGAWIVVRSIAKKQRIDISLPGASERPQPLDE